MKIDEKFNKREAKLITLQATTVHGGPQYAEGICVTFAEKIGPGCRDLRLHMTPAEAMKFAQDLMATASRLMIEDPRLFRRELA